MARSKNSEVIITGETVITGARMVPKSAPVSPKTAIPNGAFPKEGPPAARRVRKKTKVIDAKSVDLPPVAKKINPTSPKMQGKAIAETVVSSMLDRIKMEAQKNGGQLSLSDINALTVEFEAQTEALSTAFEKSFEAYVQVRERSAWDNKRDYPFDRLIVKQFSHLFDSKQAGQIDLVSRRILPGFFIALGMLLGPDVIDELQERCRGVVERLRGQLGDEFDWAVVYDAKDTKVLLLDALMPIAHHFEDLDKRRDWFLELVNSHLSPPSPSDKDEANWEMDVLGFNQFIIALLQSLGRHLADADSALRLKKRYGDAAVDTAQYVLGQIK